MWKKNISHIEFDLRKKMRNKCAYLLLHYGVDQKMKFALIANILAGKKWYATSSN